MKRFSFFAIPLFLLLLSLFLLCSCLNPQKSFEAGDYEGTLAKLEWKKDLSNEDYLLRADSLFALDRTYESLKYYMLYVLLSDPSDSMFQYAVSRFILTNPYDSLMVLVLDSSYGLEARKALYNAYSSLGDETNSNEIIGLLSKDMTFSQLLSFVLERPVSGTSIADLFLSWSQSLNDDEKPAFLELLLRFSETDAIDEQSTKICLGITDAMMDDSFFDADDILLSALLRTKGNILEKLYDRVNARMYWNQAYKLNPNDESLLEKLAR